LTEAVRRRPYRVILLDEVEKAHPDVFNILLQILEDGRLTDGHGRTVDFKNAVVIMTSNLGTEEFRRQSVGFLQRDKDEEQRLRNSIETALRNTFRPELLNRVDDTIIFHSLTEEHLAKIVDLLIVDVEQRLSERNIALEVNDEAKLWLISKGYNPEYGARPLRRAIQRYVENPLSTKILQGEFKEGDTISVGVEGEELVFTKGEPVATKDS
jgi:ATP-dependent Clp protease ATP-binding subunit ClpC